MDVRGDAVSVLLITATAAGVFLLLYGRGASSAAESAQGLRPL